MSDDVHQTLIVAAIVIGQRRVTAGFSLFKKRDETGQIQFECNFDSFGHHIFREQCL